METDVDEVQRPDTRRRTTRWILVVVGVFLLGILGIGIKFLNDARLTFAYEGPTELTAPGDTVTIRDPHGRCGPLVVSLHSESILGFWSQIHSGNVVHGFTRDERPWWFPNGGSYITPVPCSFNRSSTFVLPEDVTADVIAACDVDGRCARVPVDH